MRLMVAFRSCVSTTEGHWGRDSLPSAGEVVVVGDLSILNSPLTCIVTEITSAIPGEHLNSMICKTREFYYACCFSSLEAVL